MSGRDKARILVVDDAPDMLEVLQRKLAARGYAVFTAPGGPEAKKVLDGTPVDLVITDMKMPHVGGLDLIRYVQENLPDTEVVVITGYASVPDAVEAVKTGAEEYLAKPFTNEELLAAVSRVLAKLAARREVRRETSPEKVSRFGLAGESKAMRLVYRSIEKAATTSATVLITGESGTGKELVARAIHYASARASAPFVPVNCGAVPEGLLESELFGHIKGAFTGASDTRAGFFQTADGGSIFLDEISETSLAMQVKLLRVLQDKEVYMVGSRRPQKTDVRVLAATNKDPAGLVEKGSFREDLYYRLAVITINVPPLRARGADVLVLTRLFLNKFSKDLGRTPPELSDNVIESFCGYNWPGNVRELENVIQQLVTMTESKVLNVTDLPSVMRFQPAGTVGVRRTLEEVEAEYMAQVLSSVGGNKTEAAKILGVDRKTLREKLKKINADKD